MIRCSEEECLDWLPQRTRQVQLHDDEPNSENKKDNYFIPPHFYCVETICAPYGAVHAWTLFNVAESPTHIVNVVVEDDVYGNPHYKHASNTQVCLVIKLKSH